MSCTHGNKERSFIRRDGEGPTWSCRKCGVGFSSIEAAIEAEVGIDITEAQAPTGDWISVDERLPDPVTKPWSGFDDDRYFLLWRSDTRDWCRGRLHYDHDDDGKPIVRGWRTDGEGWDVEPSHWMPGPEGPC